ncbi:MAG: hypothetical protein ABFS43_00820 [Thermodesulfobacteriota bacterium]
MTIGTERQFCICMDGKCIFLGRKLDQTNPDSPGWAWESSLFRQKQVFEQLVMFGDERFGSDNV